MYGWTPDTVQLAVGPEGSGAPPHEHDAALNTAFFGRKRWALVPPRSKFWTRQSTLGWFSDARNHAGAMHCVQHPTDTFFVPPGWAHAVLNLEDTVAVAVEVKFPGSVPPDNAEELMENAEDTAHGYGQGTEGEATVQEP